MSLPHDLPADITVTEGIHGTWYYHLSKKESPHLGLCGDHTMISSFPLRQWGYVSHLHERYCSRCVAAVTNKSTPSNS